MKIKYRSNLSAGCISIIMSVALFLIIPSQVALENQAVHGINTRSLPYALCILLLVAGIGLIVQSLVLKKDEYKELELKKELKGLLYMGCLGIYGLGFRYSFLISTCLLGIVTLVFIKSNRLLYYVVVIAVVVVLYFLFTGVLHVRLP